MDPIDQGRYQRLRLRHAQSLVVDLFKRLEEVKTRTGLTETELVKTADSSSALISYEDTIVISIQMSVADCVSTAHKCRGVFSCSLHEYTRRLAFS